MKNLVIVESPAKAKTINKYLGKNFTVLASVGHVKDLPKSKLGVDVENDFEPEYEVIRGKGKVITELKKAAKGADAIYLAPDPDREGEAIAWHIAEEIGNMKVSAKTKPPVIYRVLFNEVTERAIKEAIKNPFEIDSNKFDAQQARRVLDRLVGYQVSPILWDKVRRGLSAGRVQSVAVRLICEREELIKAFNPVEYWSITTIFTEGSTDFEAKLSKISGKKAVVSTKEEASEITNYFKTGKFLVSNIVKKERKKHPTPPFITSRLQQEASRKLGFTAKKTMAVAQQLYQGVEVGKAGLVGLITYMRTDSNRIAMEAINDVRGFIEAKYGKEFLPDKPNFYKSKKSAQEAHECIRPTFCKYPPEVIKASLSRDQFRLYDLIWKRFVACQMVPAVMDQTRVEITSDKYMVQANGNVVKFQGFTAVYEEGRDDDIPDDDKEGSLPDIKEGTEYSAKEVNPKQHFTQPPPRFSEATLVKELEENGIGRPSTYAAIITTIQDREYVVKEGRQLAPTELGFMVTGLLVTSFPNILSVEFTAKLEEELDKVEEGTVKWKTVMKNFYGPFKESLEKAKTDMVSLKTKEEETDLKCDKCGNMMIIKWGRRGKFLACKGYPDCKTTSDFEVAKDGTITPVERVEEERGECPNCKHPMIVKSGRFGRFLACSNYPTCKTTQPMKLDIACPEDSCGGQIVERMTKRKRLFWGCSKYPNCDYATWDDPTKNKESKDDTVENN